LNPKNYGPDGDPALADSQYYASGFRKFSLVCRLSNTWYQGGTNAEFVPNVDDDYLLLQPNDIYNDLNNNDGGWNVTVTVTAPAQSTTPTPPATGDTSAPPPTQAGDAFAQAVLLQHLNGNRGYYNRIVWLGMDQSDRRLYIDDALAPFPGLAAAVDSTPLAYSGNVVAFGYEGKAPNWSDTSPDGPPPDPQESIVTLPTRGVFAEAMLGHCNACEVRDVTRMWDWTEATEEEPPPIQDVTPGPRGTPDIVTPTALPQAVVQISQPPAAPDPVGLAAALRVMGTPNIFRDMSGLQELSSLLNTLTNGAVTSLAGAQKVGQQAQQKIQSMQAQQGQAAYGAYNQPAPTAAQTYDNLTAAKQIAQAAKDMGWSPQTTEAVTSDVVGGGGGALSALVSQMLLGATPTGAGQAAWPNLDKNAVLTRLQELRGNPTLFNQGSFGLCTAAVFFHHAIQKDPLQFYLAGSGLFAQGLTFLGKLKIAPGDDLRRADYNAIAKTVPMMPPQADWMLMCALRDSENWFIDLEGSPDESIAITTPTSELAGWYSETGFYSSVTSSFDPIAADPSVIDKNSNNHIVLWIDAGMIEPGMSGAHVIALESPINYDVSNQTVEFSYWTWAQPIKTINLSLSDFRKNYWGKIVAAF
jgi:hypothetical protein